jgi:protease-4
MKDFLKTVVASALGVCIALTVLSTVLFTGILILFITLMAGTESAHAPILQENEVLKIELTGLLTDRSINDPLAWLAGKQAKQQTLTDILDAIRKAKEIPQIKGIYIKNSRLFFAGRSSLGAIRRALQDFKASGKFIIAYGDDYSQSCYYLSCAADRLLLNPQGMIDLNGLAAMPTFYKGLMDKLGVKMEIFKAGTFKSAVEPYMLDKMSEPNRQQTASCLSNIWKNISSEIAADRCMTVAQLDSLINSGLLFATARHTQEAGLVDSLLYLTEMEHYMKSLTASDSPHLLSVHDLKMLPFHDQPLCAEKIAVLFAEGEITMAPTGFFPSGTVITEKEYVEELQQLKNDDNVKAVVLRINSPGGSGYISEQIWHEVAALRGEKPVVVSMGDVAASGGYYIACAADSIVAEPTTITGSIGVFGMFSTLEGLYGKAGLSSDAVKTHAFADFGDVSRSMRAGERALVQRHVEHFYDLFLTRCADGRQMSKAAIDSIGQGRVWTGEQALAIGLVDELGGLDRAIEIAAEQAGLEAFSRVDLPGEKDFLLSLIDDLSGNIRLKMAKGLLDDTAFRHLMMIENLRRQDLIQARLPFEQTFE